MVAELDLAEPLVVSTQLCLQRTNRRSGVRQQPDLLVVPHVTSRQPCVGIEAPARAARSSRQGSPRTACTGGAAARSRTWAHLRREPAGRSNVQLDALIGRAQRAGDRDLPSASMSVEKRPAAPAKSFRSAVPPLNTTRSSNTWFSPIIGRCPLTRGRAGRPATRYPRRLGVHRGDAVRAAVQTRLSLAGSPRGGRRGPGQRR